MTSFISGPAARRRSVPVTVGKVVVGGTAPVVVQSMTNTDTADVDATVAQVAALARAGSELVRITVDRDESAAAVPAIRDRLDRLNIDVPLVGDFHYIGHRLLADHPAFLKRTQPDDWHTLTAFNLENALSTPATVNNSFSKLRALLPDLEYVGNDSEVQMHIHQLQGEMAELLALSQRLSEEMDQ